MVDQTTLDHVSSKSKIRESSVIFIFRFDLAGKQINTGNKKYFGHFSLFSKIFSFKKKINFIKILISI